VSAPRQPPGAQVERTRLAWRRTTLTATGVLLFGLSTALRHRPGPAALAGLALMVLAFVGLVLVAYRRIAALSRAGGHQAGRYPAALALLGLALTVPAAALILARG
jgi:uncharacterized membrane protein YidH (DUF202 family)